MEVLKITITEYDQYSEGYWGKNKSTDGLMARQNQPPLAMQAGTCDDIIRLAEMARTLTQTNASRQRTFDEKVLLLYEE